MRKKTINFQVSLDGETHEEREIADYLINGLAVDEDCLEILNGKRLIVYALRYLALKKRNKPQNEINIKAPKTVVEEDDTPKSGLDMFFGGKE